MPTTTAPTSTTRPPYAAGTQVWWEVGAPGRNPITLTGVVSSRTELERDGYHVPGSYVDHTPVHDGGGILWPRTSWLRLTPARLAA